MKQAQISNWLLTVVLFLLGLNIAFVFRTPTWQENKELQSQVKILLDDNSNLQANYTECMHARDAILEAIKNAAEGRM